jgi:hypothetical protein
MSGSKSSARAVDDEPLAMTVHSLPVPDAQARQRMVAGRWKMLAVLAVCAAPVIASYFTYFVIRPDGRTNYGELVTPPRERPAGFATTTLEGQPADLASLKGQWVLVVTGPSSCGVECEQRLLWQRQVREALGREKDRVEKVWLVTDGAPVRDALRRAVDAAPAVHVMRAPQAQLTSWLEPGPGHRVDEHLYLIDPMGLWMMRWPVAVEPARVKRDLERLLRASAFWDQPGR